MSLLSFLGIGGKAKPLPAPAPTPAPAGMTNRQSLTALVASLPDSAGPVALLYVQDGKLKGSSFGTDTSTFIRMLGSATEAAGAALVPVNVSKSGGQA